ncbi:hypothetical protein AB0G42_21525 [Streptomyces yangpuensis]|uniref:hypothetical protein n=1 Tax=Streptomyces yangpuensis TaxID=1648182 RepID=UPI00341463E4
MAIKTVQKSGARFYYNEAAPEIKYPGVTSVVGMMPKPFLQRWAANMAAELAIDSLEFIASMAERDRDGAKKYLAGASYRYTMQRAKVGSQAHDLFERMIRGQYVGNVHPDMRAYQRHFAEFLDAVQPELIRAEDVAWSDSHQYAGSFDGILRIKLDDRGKPHPQGDPAVVIADWKTGKSTYPEVALQMSAYAHADEIVAPDGTREPMPDLDGAVVLHITDESWEFLPVEIEEVEIDGQTVNVYDYFLHLRETFHWDRVVSRRVLGDPIAEKVGTLVTGTQRRA